jgi:hypothetical protein
MFRSVVECFRPTHRISTEQPLITPEEFRRMLAETLAADPTLARRVMWPLAGTVIPFVGGMACPTVLGPGASTQNKLPKWSDGACNLVDSQVFDNGTNVGIGTTAPVTTLDVAGTIRAVLSAGAPFGTYLMPTGGAANGFRFGFGNNLFFDGTNWRTRGDGANNAGSAILTDIGLGHLQVFTLPSTGATDQVISNASFANFEKVRITADGKVGIGTTSPAEKLDVAGTIKAQGLLASLRIRLTNAAFSTAAGEDFGTASFAAGDGGMQAETGDTGGSYDETIGGLITFNDLTQTAGVTSGLNSVGAFLSARARWNSSSIGANHKFWILAGGLDNGEKLRNGWGFKARDASGTKKLYGIVRLNGSETAEVDLSTTLTTGTWLDLYAVVRSGAVDFYVNGVLKNPASTTLPSSAASTYEIRVENGGSGSGAGNAVLQVAYLTVGLPI